ncbi:phage shock protein A [Paenibacillus sp. CAA11]|uniref:PspA/IM30 family protein n=1 Tax=Paenibacillus sp. CAA11 TaxID=1532905 RepID=UPI000D3B4A33|nr:PspA/IM30 family protein [Paenibacillus sp. CAA11]AWB43277.1 phage shock protein A [Paenibacillus sp. CAA11]
MGIFKRMKNIAVADINNLLDKVEDPISMLKQYIRELEEQIGEAQKALSHQQFVERKYDALIGEAEALISKRTRQAELAVAKHEEHIAQLAVREKLIQESKLEAYRTQYSEVKRQTAVLLDEIRQLQEVYQELHVRKDYLISRINAAQAVQGIHSALKSFNPDQISQGFTRMEERVWKMEADAGAGKMVGQLAQVPLEYGQEDSLQARVKEELEKLKEQKKGDAHQAV